MWTAWGTGAVAILRLVVLAVLARLLVPADFGVVGAALVVVTFSEVFAKLGLVPAIIQRQALDSGHIRSAFTLSVLLGFLVGALVWWLAPAMEALFKVDGVAPVLRVLAWMFPVSGFGAVATGLLSRDLEFRWLANMSVLAYLFGYAVIGIGAALAGWGVWALVAANLGNGVLMTVASLLKRPPSRGRPLELGAVRDLAAFGAGASLGRIPQYIGTQIDNLVVGRALGAEALGVYGRAYQFIKLPAQVLSIAVGRPLLSTMSKVQHETDRLAAAYRAAIAGTALFLLPAGAVLFVLADDIVNVVLGSQWTGAVLPLRALAVAMLFRVGDSLSDSLYKAVGAVFRGAWRAWFYALLVLACASVGQRWGLVGVAVGVSIAYAINYFVMAQLCLNLVGMRWATWWRAHLPALPWTLLSGLVAWGVSAGLEQLGLGSLVQVVAAIAAVLASSLLLGWRFPRLIGADGLALIQLFRSTLPVSRKTHIGDDQQPEEGDPGLVDKDSAGGSDE